MTCRINLGWCVVRTAQLQQASHFHYSTAASRVMFVQLSVLVVDEVDCLVSVKQRVLYTLFDWPFHPSSRLVLIAIANTIDLPEKILSSRCASRIGEIRLACRRTSELQKQLASAENNC